MTVSRARILAVVASLGYVPAHILGIASIWLVLLGVSIVLLHRSQLAWSLSHAELNALHSFNPNQCTSLTVRFLIETAIIASLGFELSLLLHLNAYLPLEPVMGLDRDLFNSTIGIVVGAEFDYGTLTFPAQYTIQVTANSLLILGLSCVISRRHVANLVDAVVPRLNLAEANIVRRGQRNLSYEGILYINAALLFAVGFSYILLIQFCMSPELSGAPFVLHLLAPILTFSSLSGFLLLAKDINVLRKYFNDSATGSAECSRTETHRSSR